MGRSRCRNGVRERNRGRRGGRGVRGRWEEEGRREESELRKSRNNKPEKGRRVGGGKVSRKRKAHRSLLPGPKSPLAHRAL